MTYPPLPSLDALLAHADFVRAAARGVLGGDGEVEDVVQETWLRAMGHGPRDPGALRSWLRRIAHNLAIDVWRRGERRQRREQAVARAEALPAVEAIVEREEARRRLVGALLALDKPYRDPLLLRYYEGLSVPEVARRLEVPLETARTRLRRGLERLRAQLGGGSEGRAGAWSVGLVPWALERGVPAALGGIAMKKVAVGALLFALAGAAVGGGLLLVRERKAADEEATGLAAHSASAGGQPEASAGPELHGAPSASMLPEPVDLDAADRDLDIHGVVVDAGNRPIAGATLQVILHPWRRGTLIVPGTWEAEALGASTRSARDGTFSLRLARGTQFDLRVSASGFATMDRRDCLAGQRLRLVLGAGTTLMLALQAEDGRSTQGTRVKARSRAATVPGFELEGQADADGRVRFQGLPAPARVGLTIEPAELGLVRRDVDLLATGEYVVPVMLPIGRAIRGRVTAQDSGEPIAGATAAIGWTRLRPVQTDADGRYELRGWHDRQGASELSVSAPGWGAVKVVVGEREVLDVALARGDTVVGRVVGPDAAPLSGVRVALVPSGQRAGSTEGDAAQALETAADGRFRFLGARRDQEHAVVLMAAGLGRTLLDVAPHPGEPGTIDLGDIVPGPGQSVEGRVLDAEGHPCPDVQVRLRGANADRRRLVGTEVTTEPAFYGQAEEGRSDDLGRFRFVDLSPGSYRVSARREGLPDSHATVELAPGEDRRDVVVSLASGRAISVTVIDGHGRPVPTAWVEVRGGPVHVNGVRVDGDGRATVFVRREDKTLAAVQMSDDSSMTRLLPVWDVPIPRDEAAIVLTMQEAAFITGVVRDAQGSPVPGAQLRISGATPVPYSNQTGRGGEFKIELPVGATVDVRVEGVIVPSPNGELRPASGELLAVPAGRLGVEVIARVVPMDRTLTVLVLAPDGSPEPGAQVSASFRVMGVFPRAPNSRWARTDPEGRARFTDLTGDAWDVVVNVGESSPLRTRPLLRSRVSVRPDGQEFTLRLREGVFVVGQVVAPGTQDLSGTRVGWVQEDGSDPGNPVGCSAEGWFRVIFDPDARRPWVLLARGGGATAGMSGRLEFDRPPEGKVRIEFRPR